MLGLIICGLENSGTTITQKLIGQLSGLKIGTAPDLHCGAECGVLNYDSVEMFNNDEHYSKWFKKGYELDENIEAETFEEFYSKLSETGKFNKKSGKIVDKTPNYLHFIEKVHSNAPDVPILIVRKNPYNAIASLVYRSKSLGEAIELYSLYYQKKLVWAEKNLIHGKGCYIVEFENLITNPNEEVKKIADWLNLKMPKKFDTTMLREVKHYSERLTPDDIQTIKRAFNLKK